MQWVNSYIYYRRRERHFFHCLRMTCASACGESFRKNRFRKTGLRMRKRSSARGTQVSACGNDSPGARGTPISACGDVPPHAEHRSLRRSSTRGIQVSACGNDSPGARGTPISACGDVSPHAEHWSLRRSSARGTPIETY